MRLSETCDRMKNTEYINRCEIKGEDHMKGVQLTKMMQDLKLKNLTPDIDMSDRVLTTSEINRPALQLAGYLEHFANERAQIIGYVE